MKFSRNGRYLATGARGPPAPPPACLWHVPPRMRAPRAPTQNHVQAACAPCLHATPRSCRPALPASAGMVWGGRCRSLPQASCRPPCRYMPCWPACHYVPARPAAPPCCSRTGLHDPRVGGVPLSRLPQRPLHPRRGAAQRQQTAGAPGGGAGCVHWPALTCAASLGGGPQGSACAASRGDCLSAGGWVGGWLGGLQLLTAACSLKALAPLPPWRSRRRRGGAGAGRGSRGAGRPFGGGVPAAALQVRGGACRHVPAWEGSALQEEAGGVLARRIIAGAPHALGSACVPCCCPCLLPPCVPCAPCLERWRADLPCRVYRGHKQDVLDLCWSKTQVRRLAGEALGRGGAWQGRLLLLTRPAAACVNGQTNPHAAGTRAFTSQALRRALPARPQFLLSASMDKTVRLWHVSMDECLRVFK